MKKVREFLFVVILFYDVYSYPDIRCPYPSERRYRSRWVCNSMSTEKYTCLYNAIQKKHEESCKFKPAISEEGKEYQISVYPDPVSCKNQNRYQPFRLRSNITSECVLLKSTCSDEGQYLFNRGSATNDHRCGCDFQKGFGFVNKTKRPCDCIPSTEDCSCYMKKNKCVSGFMLSSDYKCIHVNNKKHVSPCPGFVPNSGQNNTQSLSLLPGSKTEDYGRRMSKTPVIILACGCIFYVICVFTFLLTNKIPRCLTSDISPPFGLKAYQNGSSLTLSWSIKSVRYLTHQIQEFKIYHTYNNWNDQLYERVAADIMQYDFGKLLPSRTYRFKVSTSFSNLVESKCCEEVSVVTDRPTPPEKIEVTEHEDELEISWTKPLVPVFEFVKEYRIYLKEGDKNICETVGKNKSTFLKQFCLPFTTYKVNMVTCTVNGVDSEQSHVVETKTKGPTPPEKIEVTEIEDTLKVSWMKPLIPVFEFVKEYRIYLKEGDRKFYETVGKDKSTFLQQFCLPFTTYKVSMVTCTVNGVDSERSQVVEIKTKGPTPPEKIKVTEYEDTLEVSWIKPLVPVFEFVKEYRIYFEEGDRKFCETVGKDRSTFLKQFCLPFTTYKVSMVTCTVNGADSERSQVLETKTKDFSRTERENFLRLSKLIRKVAYRVIKDKVGKEYHISDPGKWFEQNKRTLESHLTEDQIKELLLAIKTGNYEDMVFDIRLLFDLLFCLKGWPFTKTHRNKSENDENNSEISDLYRIETCLTQIEKTKNNKIASKEFESLWNDVSQAIIRLGGERYKLWYERLRVNQTIKQENEETWLYGEISQSSCKEVNKLNIERQIIENDLEQDKEHQNKQQENMDYHNQTQKSLQNDDDKIKQGNASLIFCPGSHQLMIKRLKEDNKRFKKIKVVSDIVSSLFTDNNCITITGIPGIGKTATFAGWLRSLSTVFSYLGIINSKTFEAVHNCCMNG